MRPVVEFLRREDGPSAVEYVVVMALVVVLVAAVASIGTAGLRPR